MTLDCFHILFIVPACFLREREGRWLMEILSTRKLLKLVFRGSFHGSGTEKVFSTWDVLYTHILP
jgi:hypothetical protein